MHSVRICSLHDLPERNPVCSSRSNVSTSSFSLFSSTLQKTFPVTDSSVIPLQLLQSLRHPFFDSGTIIPCLQSFGTSSVCHIVLNNFVISLTTAPHRTVAIRRVYHAVLLLLLFSVCWLPYWSLLHRCLQDLQYIDCSNDIFSVEVEKIVGYWLIETVWDFDAETICDLRILQLR